MGLEAFKPIIDLMSGISLKGVSSTLAIIGVSIIAIIAFAYAIYYLVKFGRLILSMKLKHFTLTLLIIGAVFLVLALVLP